MDKLTMQPPDFAALAQSLRQIDFFSSLTIGQLEQVVPYIMLYACKDGETVFKQGSVGDAFYIVYQGAVEVRVKKGFFSFAKTVKTLGPGNFFGEMALLSNDTRSASVVCKGLTKLFVLLSADFTFIVRQNPSFADEMKKSAERRRFATSHDNG